MSVYIDCFNARKFGLTLCHMIADGDDELQLMARKIGLKKEWQHNDHYDVSVDKKKLAIKNGAIEVKDMMKFALLSRKIRVARYEAKGGKI